MTKRQIPHAFYGAISSAPLHAYVLFVAPTSRNTIEAVQVPNYFRH